MNHYLIYGGGEGWDIFELKKNYISFKKMKEKKNIDSKTNKDNLSPVPHQPPEIGK